MGDSDGFSENTCNETWISLVAGLGEIHMADALGLPSVRGRNDVVDWTKLLFHDIGPMKLCLQRIAWNGKQNQGLCRLTGTSADTLDDHTSVLLGNAPASRAR